MAEVQDEVLGQYSKSPRTRQSTDTTFEQPTPSADSKASKAEYAEFMAKLFANHPSQPGKPRRPRLTSLDMWNMSDSSKALREAAESKTEFSVKENAKGQARVELPQQHFERAKQGEIATVEGNAVPGSRHPRSSPNRPTYGSTGNCRVERKDGTHPSSLKPTRQDKYRITKSPGKVALRQKIDSTERLRSGLAKGANMDLD